MKNFNNKNNNQNNDNNNNNFFNQNPLLTFAIFSIVVIVLFKTIVGDGSALNSGSNKPTTTKDVSYSEIKNMIENEQVDHVAVGEQSIKAVSEQNGQRTLYMAKSVQNDDTLVPLLEQKNISYSGFSEGNWFSDMLFGWLIPIFIFFAIWLFLANRMQKNMGGGMLGMNKGDGVISSEKPEVKFDDVAGAKEAKDEVSEIVEFLRYPERYIELGAKIPKGVLLVGPPGTGKTLLAKAVAGEADVPFFSMSGSSFIEMFVGVGASRVRDLFEKAKKDAPAIIFIDELDAIGKSRNSGGPMGGNDEREQTLNQLLAEMDGFSSDLPIIVLAATNRPEVLDPALLRPGRFDRQVLVDKPDFEGRKEILKVHIKDIKLAPEVDIDELARMTAGLAGADLANIINEAALLAGRKSKKSVEQKDFFEAVERAIAGLEKKSRRINPKEKKIVAYHECGHALLAETTKGAKRVSKVSIVPRGMAALGYTLNKPEENRFLMQKHELVAEVDVLLGGRAAEEVFLKEISTGASNDLERATDIIKSMVSLYGMTDVAGLMVLRKQSNQFLGGSMSSIEYSDKTAQDLDEFVKSFLNERYEHVKARLEEYRGAIENIVAQLFDKETIEGEEVTRLIEEFEKENGIETKITQEEKSSDEKEGDKDKESKNENDSDKDGEK
ncbi:MAG: ATP-dependent zinc metalloprotease FtsH [Campylobacterota bacterium]